MGVREVQRASHEVRQAAPLQAPASAYARRRVMLIAPPTPTESYSEEYRHACEVTHCARMNDADLRAHLDGVRAKRNEQAAKRLWRDVKQARRVD